MPLSTDVTMPKDVDAVFRSFDEDGDGAIDSVELSKNRTPSPLHGWRCTSTLQQRSFSTPKMRAGPLSAWPPRGGGVEAPPITS